MVSSVFKLLVAANLVVAVVGLSSKRQVPPPLPSVISVNKSGRADGYSRVGESYVKTDQIQMKWDLERNCFGAVKFSLSRINDLNEFVYCGS